MKASYVHRKLMIWTWKKCWIPGCNITKHDNLEEKMSSAFFSFPLPSPPQLFIQYTTAVRPHKKFAQIYMVKVGWESRISSAAKAWAFFYFFSSWKPMWHYGIKSAFQGGSCIISMYDAFLRCDDLEQSSYLYMVALYLLNSSSQFWIPRGRW